VEARRALLKQHTGGVAVLRAMKKAGMLIFTTEKLTALAMNSSCPVSGPLLSVPPTPKYPVVPGCPPPADV
jgi:hypothetical protein